MNQRSAVRFACWTVVVFLLMLNVSTYLYQSERTAFAQSQQTVQRILNDVWDKASKRLMTTPWAGAQGPSQSETFIFNDVWDQANHLLRTSGVGSSEPGGSGLGDVIVGGTPLTGQAVFWTDDHTIKGSSSTIIADIICDDNTSQSAALQTIINNAPVYSKIVLPAGLCRLNSSLTINKYLTLEGAGLDQTFLIQNTTNIPILTVSSINVNLMNFTAKHNGNAVAGGDGIIVRGPNGESLQSVNITNVSASWNYRGFVLGCMAYGQVAHSIALMNNSHGWEFLYEDAPGCGVDQWDLLHVNATLNKGAGFYGRNTASATGLGPWLTQTISFANDQGGYVFQGTPGHPINDIRLHNNLSSFDNVHGIFLDTYGGSHIVSGAWIEDTGLSNGYPLGSAQTPSTPSNTGHCLEVTANNDLNGRTTISGGLYWNCAWSGVALYAPLSSLTGGSSAGNGRALDGNAAHRAAVVLGGNGTQVSDHSFGTPTASTTSYVHIAAGVTNPVIGFNTYDPALPAPLMQGLSLLNTFPTGLTPNRCVETDNTGKLGVATTTCGVGGGGGSGIAGATNHGMMIATGGTTASSLGVAIDGQLAIGSTGADPVLARITGAADQIEVLNGPGTIQVKIATNPTLPGTTFGLFQGPLILPGTTSGSVTLRAPAVAGTNTVTFPAGTTDFSTTGGTSQVVKQLAPGAPLTVGPVSAADVGLGSVDNTSDATKNAAAVTLLNKLVPPRTGPCTPSANVITPNMDTTDTCEYHTLTAPTSIANPTYTSPRPYANQRLEIVLKSATPQALTFGTLYDPGCGQPLPTSTIGNGAAVDRFLFVWNENTAKLCLAASLQPPLKRITTLASSTTFTCPRDVSDQCKMTMTGGAGTLIVAAPTGAPVDGDVLQFRFRCTNAQAFTWNGIFLAGPGITLPTTCPATLTQETIVEVLYSADLVKWQQVLPGGTGTGGGGLTGSTGYVLLPMAAVVQPTTAMAVIDVSENNPRLLFDAATQQCAWWAFKMPPDYTSTPVFKFPYSMVSGTTGGVAIDVYLMAVTAGDAGDANTDSYATVNTCTDTVPGTVGQMKEISCALTNTDALAARDIVRLKLCRQVAHASDTATGTMEGLAAAALEYIR